MGARQVLNKRMLLMLFGCLLLFGAIFGYKLFSRYMTNRALDTMPLPTATVNAARAEYKSWRGGVEAVGTLRAINGVQVTTQAEGEVKAIYFESGQSVSKGDLLIELTAAPEVARIQVLQAELRLAERTHKRIEVLRASGVATQAEMDDAQSTLDRVLANIAVQKATIAEHRIYAPFSGKLGIRQVDLGQNVKPGDAVVSLQQLDPIYVDFPLPEQYVSSVAEGFPVNITLGAFAEQVFHGRITAVSPRVDASSRTFLAQATLENPKHQLLPGMFADVSVQVESERRVLVVPRTAISYAPYGNSVFVLQKNGKEKNAWIAIKRFVKTGEERGDLVEIIQGLQAGEQVATSGLLKLRNKGVVIINNENPPPEDENPQPENS